jgi:hypothetical protein
MPSQRLPIRREAVGEGQGAAFEGEEGGGVQRGWVFDLQQRGEDDAEVFVECDVAAVEGAVVEGVQGEAVAGVGAAGDVFAPGEDVGLRAGTESVPYR